MSLGIDITIFLSAEDGGFIPDIPDLKSCSAFGETPEEAAREVQNARALFLESCQQRGDPVPEPR